MAKIQEIKVINIDERAIEVDSLSPDIQATVQLFNDWRQEAEDIRVQHLKAELALKALGQDILGMIREEEKKAAEAQAEAETPTEEPAAIVGEVV